MPDRPRLTIRGKVVDPPQQPIGGPTWDDKVLSNQEEVGSDQDVATVRLDDVLISNPSRSKQPITRRLLRPSSVPINKRDPSARVRATLMHQRRRAMDAAAQKDWEDADHFSLANLKAGEQVRLELSTGETKRLFLELTRLYMSAGSLDAILSESGVTAFDKSDGMILRGSERRIIERLIELEGSRFWEHIRALKLTLPQAVLLQQQHAAREQALSVFSRQMASNDWHERRWEQFFQDNTWIFGFGLAYQFLSTVQSQPHYGGNRLDGRGAQRGDFLMGTEAEARFVVLVDIKRPSTDLLAARPYRESIYSVSSEISGGVAQLQANCETWLTQGARQQQNFGRQAEAQLHTHEPKAILIAGHTREFDDDSDRAGSFERFRRSLRNPEIITYDELFERARYLVKIDREKTQ